MYPILFTIPGIDYRVTSFGVMMLLGFLVAYWLTKQELPSKGIDPARSFDLLFFIMIGGVAGSKLYYATDLWIREGQPWMTGLLRSEGLTWYGGLAGGIAAGALACRFYGLEFRRLLEAGAVATAVGQALGRVGCFLVGDDYGSGSDLPWAIAFPEGSPPTHERVHPTQLYEVAWLLPVAAFLYSRRRKSPFLFGEYMVANGLGRIFIEELRLNPEVALGLTEPQWVGIALVVAGSLSWLHFRRVDARLAVGDRTA